jgi:hypothetical protein
MYGMFTNESSFSDKGLIKHESIIWTIIITYNLAT